MPFTPFHFGPGALLKAAFRRHFAFSIFVITQVVTDLETASNIYLGNYPLHGFLHTYLGATLLAAAVTFIGYGISIRFLKREIPLHSIALASFLGTWSHVFLDSIMHGDVRPWAPFSNENALYRICSLYTLHLSCLILGLVGFGCWFWHFKVVKRLERK